MRTIDEHDFGTYPRRFNAYRWFKPLLVGLLFVVFKILFDSIINSLTEMLFSITASGMNYDTVDFYTIPGVFSNGGRAADVIPCLIFAALIVKDRPVSSYFSSMGGWRWNVFFKTLAAGLIIVGLPNIARYIILGKTGDVRFTAGGLVLMLLLMPLQAVGEEILFRGYIMQTTGSWFKLTLVGVIVQTLAFAAVHPYNMIGVIGIIAAAIVYALVCIFSKGIESSSALHMVGNISGILMAGFGFGKITSETTVMGMVRGRIPDILFLLFIIYADKKLRWFDEVKYDDVALFNSKEKKHKIQDNC